MRQGQQPFSRHAGFFATLRRVEDRLASEQCQEQKKSPPPPAATATTRQSEASTFSETMTASPLLLLDPAPPPAPSSATDRDSSAPALDFLTTVTEQDQQLIQQDDDDHYSSGEDIARLMALLGLSPPPPGGGDSNRDDDDDYEGGCDCSGADGFLAKVVGVAGPKCDREEGRLGAWIRHYHRGEGGCREPARLAHLLLAMASADTPTIAFPGTVREFLDRDPPPQLTDTSE